MKNTTGLLALTNICCKRDNIFMITIRLLLRYSVCYHNPKLSQPRIHVINLLSPVCFYKYNRGLTASPVAITCCKWLKGICRSHLFSVSCCAAAVGRSMNSDAPPFRRPEILGPPIPQAAQHLHSTNRTHLHFTGRTHRLNIIRRLV